MQELYLQRRTSTNGKFQLFSLKPYKIATQLKIKKQFIQQEYLFLTLSIQSLTIPQETEIQEDLKNFLSYYNIQSNVEVTRLLENTVSEFSKHFTTFCSLQKEQIAEQKLIWDQSIVNLTNLQYPKELIKKST